MFFLLLGEGGSDLGKSHSHPGPLIIPLQQLAEVAVGAEFEYDYVGRAELSDAAPAKAPGQERKMLIRGNKRKFAGLASIQRTAEALGSKASKLEECGVVYFSDCDYTNREVNNPELYYEDVIRSMEHGFYSVPGFRTGVPMVPRPRSESWFLCHYQEHPYTCCERFEHLPANDDAPGSGKRLLGEFFHCPPTVPEIYSRINSDEVKWLELGIPSYLFFRKRFEHVAQRLAHVATTFPENETLMSDDLV